MPALTSGDKPKSSALTIRRFKSHHRDQSKSKAPLDFASIAPLAQARFVMSK
jgi:hypothetical protein